LTAGGWAAVVCVEAVVLEDDGLEDDVECVLEDPHPPTPSATAARARRARVDRILSLMALLIGFTAV
jgi:hypothetical protein